MSLTWWEKTLVLIFILCCFPSISSSEYIVYPEGEDCPTPEPCLTLQDYTKNVTGYGYFASNSSFLFLPGQHQLNRYLNLFSDNLTLRGDPSSERARIIVSGGLTVNGNNIAFNFLILHFIFNSSGMSIGMMFQGRMFNMSSTKFIVENSEIIVKSYGYFIGCSFYGSGTVSIVYNSNVTYLNTKFSGPRITIGSSVVVFSGLTQFTDIHNGDGNEGGALYLEKSDITMSGFMKFIGNSADIGGAMYIDEFSRINLQAPLELTFKNNSARTGGALALEYQCMSGCFFTIMDKHDIHLTFENNFAECGSAIYGGNMDCRMSNGISTPNSTCLEVLKNISTFSEQSAIFSHLCFCFSKKPICSNKSLPIDTIPGREFNISIVGVTTLSPPDDSVTIQVQNDPVITTEEIYSSCTNITLQVLKPKGYHGNIKNISVWPEGCHEKMLNVTVHFDDCPNGFAIENGGCECSKKVISRVRVECDIQTGLINKTVYSDWIWPILNETGGYLGIIWSNNCPSGYCNQSSVMMDFSSNNTDSQCREHRTGVLCGQCEQNYSLILSNFQCRKCSSDHLGLLVFFAVAGLGLIILLLALNMTVASGTLNGFILYVNIVSVYKDSFFPFEMSMNPLGVFISWMNLDFGIPSCFYNGLDAYQYFWLQYAFPLYLWFLIGVIILASRYSIRVGNLLARADPVAVLATIILMSYNKLLVSAVGVLTFKYLHNSFNAKETMVWAFDGNIEYFKGNHFIPAIVAICVVIFLLFPYIFLLMFGYRLHAYTDRKGFRWFEKIALFLNSYYVPFKKSTRYWSGFLLMVRVVIFVGFLASSGDEVAVIFIFVIVSWLSRGIYCNRCLDILESSFIFNICILLAGTYYIKIYGGDQTALSYMCIGVAFVEFLGIVAFHFHLRLKVLHRCYCIGGHGGGIQPAAVNTDYSSNAHYREPLLDTNQGTCARKYS